MGAILRARIPYGRRVHTWYDYRLVWSEHPWVLLVFALALACVVAGIIGTIVVNVFAIVFIPAADRLRPPPDRDAQVRLSAGQRRRSCGMASGPAAGRPSTLANPRRSPHPVLIDAARGSSLDVGRRSRSSMSACSADAPARPCAGRPATGQRRGVAQTAELVDQAVAGGVGAGPDAPAGDRVAPRRRLIRRPSATFGTNRRRSRSSIASSRSRSSSVKPSRSENIRALPPCATVPVVEPEPLEQFARRRPCRRARRSSR